MQGSGKFFLLLAKRVGIIDIFLSPRPLCQPACGPLPQDTFHLAIFTRSILCSCVFNHTRACCSWSRDHAITSIARWWSGGRMEATCIARDCVTRARVCKLNVFEDLLAVHSLRSVYFCMRYACALYPHI
jgi:hypothetical protein